MQRPLRVEVEAIDVRIVFHTREGKGTRTKKVGQDQELGKEGKDRLTVHALPQSNLVSIHSPTFPLPLPPHSPRPKENPRITHLQIPANLPPQSADALPSSTTRLERCRLVDIQPVVAEARAADAQLEEEVLYYRFASSSILGWERRGVRTGYIS